MVLETRNLWLKTTEEQDAEALHENYFSIFEASRHMLWKVSQNLEETQEKLKFMSECENSMIFTVIKKQDRSVIGFMSITKNKENEKLIDNIGFGFNPKNTHIGLGVELLFSAIEYCFGDLGAEQVGASYISQIGVSGNLYTKFGFVEDEDRGVTKYRKSAGQTIDIINLKLTKEMWQSQKALILGR